MPSANIVTTTVAGEGEAPSKAFSSENTVVVVTKDSFEHDSHFYPKTINAQLSEIVSDFMSLGLYYYSNSTFIDHCVPICDDHHNTIVKYLIN